MLYRNRRILSCTQIPYTIIVISEGIFNTNRREVIEVTSQVAQLRANIELELIAMHQGLNGLAADTTKHEFIEAKMHHLGVFEDQLAAHIGNDQAVQFSCEAYIQAMEGQ
jgi:hypothetical protein